jgi:hypothetical protein
MAEAFLQHLSSLTSTDQFYPLFQQLLRTDLNIVLWKNGDITLGKKKDAPQLSEDDLLLFCYAFLFFTFYKDIMLFGFESDLQAWKAVISFMESQFHSVEEDINTLKFFKNSIFYRKDFFASLYPLHGAKKNLPSACKSIIQFCRAKVDENEKEIHRAAKEQAKEQAAKEENGNAYHGIWFQWNNYLCAIMVCKYFFN